MQDILSTVVMEGNQLPMETLHYSQHYLNELPQDLTVLLTNSDYGKQKPVDNHNSAPAKKH